MFRNWIYGSKSLLDAQTGNAHECDHILIRTHLKAYLSSAPKKPCARRVDVAQIRQANTSEALNREIRSCSTTRADGEENSPWSSLKISGYGTAEKIPGYTR
ncbi:unnamed protein product [Dibothriocephalus latus]|uniref:Uncharacterized protein n=1 Tax=Dibothriocephalus latus TaxID=60516 RepID=A0A3P7LJA0_DIBLA|nr:unnamed protein product [Dibothriocephalus latus]